MAEQQAVSMKDLRTMPEPEVTAQMEKLRQEYWQHRVKAREGSLQQTHQLRAARRQIARLLTVLREKR
jgi:large subunit ribosomal protein L29